MIGPLVAHDLCRAKSPRDLRPGFAQEADERQFIVGMTNSAPSLMPDGQREVTVLVFV
jgi:hypothetical protein